MNTESPLKLVLSVSLECGLEELWYECESDFFCDMHQIAMRLGLKVPLILVEMLDATKGSPNDALSSIVQAYLEKSETITPGSYWSVVRLGLMLTLQTLICSGIFVRFRGKMRSGGLMVIQWLSSLVIFWLIALVPLHHNWLSPRPKAFILGISWFSIAVLPWRLSWFLVPKAGHRKILAGIIYTSVLILLIAQSCRST